MKCYKWIDQSMLQFHLTTLKSQGQTVRKRE